MIRPLRRGVPIALVSGVARSSPRFAAVEPRFDPFPLAPLASVIAVTVVTVVAVTVVAPGLVAHISTDGVARVAGRRSIVSASATAAATATASPPPSAASLTAVVVSAALARGVGRRVERCVCRVPPLTRIVAGMGSAGRSIVVVASCRPIIAGLHVAPPFITTVRPRRPRGGRFLGRPGSRRLGGAGDAEFGGEFVPRA
ncbi:MAG: hypothetical protein ACKO40_05740 [Planctomycetaceae bacterium]